MRLSPEYVPIPSSQASARFQEQLRGCPLKLIVFTNSPKPYAKKAIEMSFNREAIEIVILRGTGSESQSFELAASLAMPPFLWLMPLANVPGECLRPIPMAIVPMASADGWFLWLMPFADAFGYLADAFGYWPVPLAVG